MPPFTGLDEEAHFVRAYGISKGDIRLVGTNQVEMPVAYRQTLGCFQFKEPVAGAIYKYNYQAYGVDKLAAIKCTLRIPHDQTNTESVYTTAAFYSPTTYVPQVFMMYIGNFFNLPIITISYMTRLAVLAVYILMIAVAIRLLPIRKWALVGVALLPHSIVHVTNPGGDYMLLGTAALLTAVIVRSIFLTDKQFREENTKLLILLTIASVLIILPKGIFPGICLLPLIFFYRGLGFRVLQKTGIVLIALLAGIGWQRFGAPAGLGQSSQPTENSITGLPMEFIRTMYFRWSDTDFLQIGDSVGTFQILGVHAGTPSIIITLISVLFAVYIFVEYRDLPKLKISERSRSLLTIFGFLGAIGIVCGSFAALYLASSDLQDGSGVIKGVQARYFYPAFIVLAVLPFRRYFRTSPAIFSRVVIVGTVVVLSSYVVRLLFEFQWGIF